MSRKFSGQETMTAQSWMPRVCSVFASGDHLDSAASIRFYLFQNRRGKATCNERKYHLNRPSSIENVGASTVATSSFRTILDISDEATADRIIKAMDRPPVPESSDRSVYLEERERGRQLLKRLYSR